MRHIKPQKELSTTHKVWKSEHFHQHGEIFRVSKIFTNDTNPTNDPGHVEYLRQLFPHPSADYVSPLQMGDDLPQHWPSEIEIHESWDTPQAFERIVKFHSVPALTSGRARFYVPPTLMDGE